MMEKVIIKNHCNMVTAVAAPEDNEHAGDTGEDDHGGDLFVQHRAATMQQSVKCRQS